MNAALTMRPWRHGFLPLEETTVFWGEDDPCLVMVKPL
jgi:hypothetical protein